MKADNFLVVAHGTAAEVGCAKTLLEIGGPTQLAVHAAQGRLAPIAA